MSSTKLDRSYKMITAKELSEMEISDDSLWLIDKLIPQKSISILTGTSDCGKSTFAKQLALSIAIGKKDFLGYQIFENTKNVLYCSTEETPEDVSFIFKKQVRGYEMANCTNLTYCIGLGNLMTMLEDYKCKEPALIIIDTISDFFTGNPNDWSKVRGQLGNIRTYAQQHNCAILGIHHNVKYSDNYEPNKNKLNGSQAFEAVTRSLLDLREDKRIKENRILTIIKSNKLSRDEKNKPIALRLDSDSLLFEISDSPKQVSTNYDKKLWIDRFTETKGDSNDGLRKVIEKLQEKHPSENVPGRTWFQENLQEETENLKIKNRVETITPI